MEDKIDRTTAIEDHPTIGDTVQHVLEDRLGCWQIEQGTVGNRHGSHPLHTDVCSCSCLPDHASTGQKPAQGDPSTHIKGRRPLKPRPIRPCQATQINTKSCCKPGRPTYNSRPSRGVPDAAWKFRNKAAVAQLVERNLAKVEVESSRLFCRSRSPQVLCSFFAPRSLQRFSVFFGFALRRTRGLLQERWRTPAPVPPHPTPEPRITNASTSAVRPAP